MSRPESTRELPCYKSHKIVHALKIRAVDNCVIHPVEENYPPFTVSYDYVQKHKPKAGGYFVQYQDGYQSYSPAEAFESGYSPIDPSAPAAPQFQIGAIVSVPSLVVDLCGASWWVDPSTQVIRKVQS